MTEAANCRWSLIWNLALPFVFAVVALHAEPISLTAAALFVALGFVTYQLVEYPTQTGE